jgi:hypothetical protein
MFFRERKLADNGFQAGMAVRCNGQCALPPRYHSPPTLSERRVVRVLADGSDGMVKSIVGMVGDDRDAGAVIIGDCGGILTGAS